MGLMNFQDWVVERQRLLNRIKELEAENTELKKRLGEDVVHVVLEPTTHKVPTAFFLVRPEWSVELHSP